MSWRETLGVNPSEDLPYTHNSHNPTEHGTPVPLPAGHGIHPVPGDTLATVPDEARIHSIPGGNCADIADSAYRDSEQEQSKLLEALADACQGLDITPAEVKEALGPEDIDDWRTGSINAVTLAAFAHSLVQRREMDQGKRPDHYTKQATCKHCGPIWLWFSGDVLGCPWCWNRTADKPIPRPCSIHCGDCIHFERIDHPHLGHCANGEPEAIAGLWGTDRRNSERFLPRPQQTHNGQPSPARAETKK